MGRSFSSPINHTVKRLPWISLPRLSFCNTASLPRFRHVLSFFLHLLNHRRDKKTSVELAYLNFNIQTCQVKALPCSILVVEPIGSQTREHLDALNDLTDQDDFLNTLFRLVECQLHEAIGHL